MIPEMKQIIASQANSGVHPALIKIGDARYYRVGSEGNTSIYTDVSDNGKDSSSFVMTNKGQIMTFHEYIVDQFSAFTHSR